MKINWFSFKGLFSCLFSLRVFLICRPCLFNNTRLPLHLNNSNILQCAFHCYAEWTTQKRAREHIVLTSRYVWDAYLCSLTQSIAWGVAYFYSWKAELICSLTCKRIVMNTCIIINNVLQFYQFQSYVIILNLMLLFWHFILSKRVAVTDSSSKTKTFGNGQMLIADTFIMQHLLLPYIHMTDL